MQEILGSNRIGNVAFFRGTIYARLLQMICLIIYPCVPLYTSIPWRVPIWTAFLVVKTDVVYVT